MLFHTQQRFLIKFLIFISFIILHSNTFSRNSMVLTPRRNAGLFSVFNTVIGCLYVYEHQKWDGLKIDFQDQGLYYDKNYGPNWWEYYFEPINLGSVDNVTLRKIPTGILLDFTLFAQFTLSRLEASKLIKKYIRLNKHIKKKIDDFFDTHFKGYYIIGVHYRGTDKICEAPHVPYEKVFYKLEHLIRNSKKNNIKIFVATDDAIFFEFIKNKFPDKVFGIDAIRSHNNKPIHFSESTQNYKKGEDAVIDCILLSKCQLLVRTASCLSDCSMCFNPNIKEIALNRSHILVRK